MKKVQQKKLKRVRRHARIRSKVRGTAGRPRLAIFKSNKFTTAQVINDDLGVTLAAGSTNSIKASTELEKSLELGKVVAKLAKAKGIDKVVFDRGGYIYTGKVKAVADGAREGGLDF
jgi:large subunit ribosomal protein L18